MVSRVSTIGNYSAVLANLMEAQQKQIKAGEVIATQKNGKDLKDFAQNAEMLTSMRAVQTRLKVYADQNSLVADRLSNQDAALNQIADAATQVRQAMADALASGRSDTLMEDIGAQLRNAVDGLNARYGGKYLFAGGQIDTAPMSATSLGDLTDPAKSLISDFLHNDQYKTQAKIDDATTVTTGVLASDVATQMMEAFKTFQTFQEGADGGFNGPLTDAQKSFLEGQIGAWETVRTDLTTIVGRNGLAQGRVESVVADLKARQNTLSGMVGGIVDADMAKAATDLTAAQLSVQAAAHVFTTLQSSSLLNMLR